MARVKGSQRDAKVTKAQQQPEFPLQTQTGKDASPEPERVCVSCWSHQNKPLSWYQQQKFCKFEAWGAGWFLLSARKGTLSASFLPL